MDTDGQRRVARHRLDLPKPLPRPRVAASGHVTLCRRPVGHALRHLQVRTHDFVDVQHAKASEEWLWRPRLHLPLLTLCPAAY